MAGKKCFKLIPDSPLSSISTLPPSTPFESSFSSERVEMIESSPTSTAFSDIGPSVSLEPKAVSLKLPVVSGITRRLSRVVTNAQANVFTIGTPRESASLLGNKRFRSGSLTSTSKSTSLAKASKSKLSVSHTSQSASSKPTIPARKIGSLGKFGPFIVTAASEGPLSTKRAKEIVPKAEPAVTPTSTQEQKLSVGRTILRRLSNLPGSVSRTRFSPNPSQMAEAKRTANFLASTSALSVKLQPQTGPKLRPAALKAPVLTATLIPTWTAGSSSPSQCDNMFRNSLSVIVR